MEKLEGMISDIVFKNEENGYTIAYLANEDEEVAIVGCMPTLSEIGRASCRERV